MILVLYQRYGRSMHGIRRAIVDLIERDDLDRRARIAEKLFRHSITKIANKEKITVEAALYDQYAFPCESRHSVGHALKWFDQAGIDYLGTWPPVDWSYFGKGLRFSADFAPYRKTRLGSLLLKIFPDFNQPPSHSPGFFTRTSMQSLWFLNQLQLFAIAGRKRD